MNLSRYTISMRENKLFLRECTDLVRNLVEIHTSSIAVGVMTTIEEIEAMVIKVS